MKHFCGLFLIAAFAVALAAGNARAQGQLLTNGNFNSPSGGSVSLPASSTMLTGWTVDFTAPQNNGITYGTAFGVPSPVISSTQSVQLATGSRNKFKEGGIQQSIATIPGQVYTLSIEAKDEFGIINSTGGIVSFGGLTFTLTTLNTSFTGFSWTEMATSSSTLVDILGNGSSVDAVVVSDFSVVLDQLPAVWSGSGSTQWGTSSNWSNSTVPNNAGVAVSFGTASANPTVDIGAASRTVGIINFVNSTPTTITSTGGNFLILDNTGGTSQSAGINVSGSHTISAPIQLNSPAAVSITSGTSQLTISGVISNGSSGSQGLMLTGAGTLALGAANTFTGTTSVASGTLLLVSNSALQNSTLAAGGVSFASGTTAPLLGGLSGNGNFALATATGQAVALSVGNNNQATNYSGAMSGQGSLTKIGTGTLTVSGASTFTGNTFVSSGTLKIGSAAALQASPLDPSGGGTFSFGTQTAPLLGGLTNTGTVNLANASLQPVSLTIGGANQNVIFSGAITGTGGSVTMNGAALQDLSGNNSYGGGTNVNGGTLQFQGGPALPSGSPIGLGGGVISIANNGSGSSGTISLGNNITLTAAATVGIDVRNNGSNSNNTVAFGVLSNGLSTNAFSSTINLTAANGYQQTFTGLNLPGSTGQTTVLVPTTTVKILGNVGNLMTTGTGGQYDTLDLDGTSTGNVIYGTISDASFSHGRVGYGDTRITKSNTSLWILAGSGNSFTGPTLISAGTLQLGTGQNGQDGILGNSGVAAGSTVTNNAALVFNYFGNVTALYPVTGSGTLSMIGPGSLTLGASNTYTGPTNISSGTLALQGGGAIMQSSTISIANGATFDVSQVGNTYELAAGQTLSGTGNYTVNGGLTVDSGAKILPGGVTSAGTLNIGGLVLSPGSSLSFDLGQNKDLINVGTAYGGLTLNGGGLSLYQSNGTSAFSTPGTYLLMNYGNGNSVNGLPSNLSVLNATNSNTYNFTATSGSLDITIGAPNVWNGGAHPSFVWSNALNWSGGPAPTSGSSVMFSGTTGLTNTNDIAGLNLTGIFFSSTAGTFGIAGNDIQLSGPITNSSPSAQKIGLNIVLSGGSQNVTASGGSIVLNGVIDDAGMGYGINITGAGGVVLGGANTYSGTTAAAAPLRLANNAALQDSTLELLSGGSLTFAAGITSPAIAGLAGSGSITLATTSGQPVALMVGGSSSVTSMFSGTLKGSGSLIKQGFGTFTLTVPQSYSGATGITGGILAIQSNNGLPAATSVSISNGATFDMTNLQQTILSLSSTDAFCNVLVGSGALTIANTAGTSTTFDGAINDQGAGGLFSVQGGKLTLTGPNNYSGATGITGGTLQLASGGNGQDGSIAGTRIVTDNGTLIYNFNDNQFVTYPITGQGSLRTIGSGTLALSASASYLGATTISGGTLQLGTGNGNDGALYVNVVSTSGVIDNGALDFDLAGSQTASYKVSGSGSLILSGGTLALSGNDSYSGGTFDDSGLLLLTSKTALAVGTSLIVGAEASSIVGIPSPQASLEPAPAAAVPEPGTLALLDAAALAAAIAAWRNRKKRY